MSRFSRYWAALTAGLFSVFALPVAAWATDNDLAARRPRGGFGFFGFGALCCLVVVAAVVIGIVMISRNRKR
jgi:hypothetical protein